MTEIIEKEMFFGASPEIIRRASELRKNMTEAERILWSALRRKQLNGRRFRRQHPIDRFIADFYCHEARLVVEVDGGIHQLRDQREYDIGRSDELDSLGLRVIRFTNEQVKNKLQEVLSEIKKWL